MRALIRKELRDVTREKSIVVAFLVQAFLAGFSALLLTGLTALHDPGSVTGEPEATVAYVGEGGFDQLLRDADNIRVRAMDGDEALQRFRESNVDMIVEESPGAVRNITLVFADGELTSTLLVAQLKSLLIDYEEQLRLGNQNKLGHEVVALDRTIKAEAPYSFVYTTLLPLLVITPVFLSGAIAGDALSQEARSRTLILLRSAPISPTRLVISKLAVPIMLVPVQVLLWLGLFALNGFPSAVLGTLLFATVLGVLLTSLGTTVAVMLRDESLTQAGYAVLVLVLGGLSLALPQDPLNIIARLATGSTNGETWLVLAGLTLLAGVSLMGGIMATRRALVTDRL